jgi:hypothetical protein
MYSPLPGLDLSELKGCITNQDLLRCFNGEPYSGIVSGWFHPQEQKWIDKNIYIPMATHVWNQIYALLYGSHNKNNPKLCLFVEGKLEHGKLTGSWKYRDRYGRIRVIVNFENDYPIGAKFYDGLGNIYRTEEYKNAGTTFRYFEESRWVPCNREK